MTNPKQLSPQQKAAATRKAKQKELYNEVLKLEQEKFDLECRCGVLESENFNLKNPNQMAIPKPVTAQSLKQDYEALVTEEVDLQKRIFIKKNEIKAFTAKSREDLKLIESYCS